MTAKESYKEGYRIARKTNYNPPYACDFKNVDETPDVKALLQGLVSYSAKRSLDKYENGYWLDFRPLSFKSLKYQKAIRQGKRSLLS